jgi:hypothetical protein
MTDKTAYIVFKESDNWSKYFLKKNFGHVFMLINDGFNWIKIEGTRAQLDINILTAFAHDAVYKRMKDMYPLSTIMKVRWHPRSEKWQMRMVRNCSCVGVVLYILGLPFYLFTPYQLFKYLKKYSKNITQCKPLTYIQPIY